MISAWAERITEMLCDAGSIDENDKELYKYGFFILLSRIIFFVLAVAVGMVFRIPGESIMFFIMFSLLRSYAGGIHAKKEWVCTVLTSLMILFSVAVLWFLRTRETVLIPLLMLLSGLVPVLVFSPVDSQGKPLSAEDGRHYRLLSWLVSIGYVILAAAGVVLKFYAVLYCAALAVFLEGSMLLYGKIAGK